MLLTALISTVIASGGKSKKDPESSFCHMQKNTGCFDVSSPKVYVLFYDCLEN